MAADRLDPDLLAIMVCPDCGGDLDERFEPHRLVCVSCGLAYPVDDGIPRMLVEEATREGDPS